MVRSLFMTAALLAIGCVKIAPFSGDAAHDGGAPGDGDASCPPSTLSTADDSQGITVRSMSTCRPSFTIVFPRAGAQFPTSWKIDGTEILRSDADTCADRGGGGMGVEIDPIGRLDGTGPRILNAELRLDGPAVVKVMLRWSLAMACGGMAHLNGTSSFTGFPDGRLQRMDDIDVTSSGDGATCTCPAGGSWRFLSYIGFPDGVFTATEPNLPNASAMQRDLPVLDGASYTCLGNATFDVIATYFGSRPRRLELATSGFDLVEESFSNGLFTIAAGDGARTVMPMRITGHADGCDARVRDLVAVTDDARVLRFDAPTTIVPEISAAGDGIFGGEFEGSTAQSYPRIPATSDGGTFVVPAQPLAPGFAIWFEWPDNPPAHPRVLVGTDGAETELVEGRDYVMQANTTTFDTPPNGKRFQLWVRDGLPQGHHLRVARP